MKVLIVDDNARMRKLIGSIVGELAEIIECKDGSEALALYKLHRPDWVLMDIRMDGLGGIEATRSILSADREARVIMVTNYDDERLRESARGAGACDYVLKDDVFSLRWILAPAGDPVERRGL